MLTTAEAAHRIAGSVDDFGTTIVPLAAASGRILRQPVEAERDQPPFDRVTMDGIAVSHASVAGGRRRFPVDGALHAGDPSRRLDSTDRCLEVMTGAVLPEGADCVIPVERISIADGIATLEDGYRPSAGQFIHPQGSDHPQGRRVLEPGLRISPQEIAVIASCGLAEVEVGRKPAVQIVSTGNELVMPGGPLAPHQIRLSNGPALAAMLANQGFDDSRHAHLADDPASLAANLEALLEEADVLILSGGVSMGKADYVPGILAELGVREVFHRISQRPGKPMWFGTGPRRQPVFALPGNPVSTMVCCRHYVLPALLAASGRTRVDREWSVLDNDVEFAAALTCFLPVRLNCTAGGELRATPVHTNTSGDFTALSGTDGYVELALEKSHFAAGSAVPLHRWSAP